MPTISDEEYAALQRAYQEASLANGVLNDPTIGKEAKRLLKRKYPQLQFPDLDVEDRNEQRWAQEEKRRKDEADQRTRSEQDEKLKTARKKTQEEYGLTDEAMTDMEKWMYERNVGDYEVAASYKAAKTPKASEPTFESGRWDHAKSENFAEIAKDPEAWGRNELLKAMQNDQMRLKGQR